MTSRIRTLVFVAVLAVALLAPTISKADERPSLTQLSQRADVGIKPEGFTDWEGRLDRARTSRKSARNLILIGGGITIVGVVLGMLTTGTSLDEYGNLEGNPKSGLAISLIGGLGGSALAGYGGWKYVSARDQIEDLDREGRTKGYLTQQWRPDDGVRLALRVTF